MSLSHPRVVSLVPSWTETLISAGVNVVGRTQFCIHPADKISSIPSVGGTKNMNLEKILALNPDFVVLDQQENKLEMAEQLRAYNINLLISDVTDLSCVMNFLKKLSSALSCATLDEYADRYQQVIKNQKQIQPDKFWQQIFIRGEEYKQSQKTDYVIWKKPFMVIGRQTFIAENLRLIEIHLDRAEKYPEVSEDELIQNYCLFSSEPYPFAKKFDELVKQGFRGALIDGEKLSWYGIRNLIFLEQCSK